MWASQIFWKNRHRATTASALYHETYLPYLATLLFGHVLSYSLFQWVFCIAVVNISMKEKPHLKNRSTTFFVTLWKWLKSGIDVAAFMSATLPQKLQSKSKQSCIFSLFLCNSKTRFFHFWLRPTEITLLFTYFGKTQKQTYLLWSEHALYFNWI